MRRYVRNINCILIITFEIEIFSQVYINVENVNDNVPMTAKPVYYPKIPEGSPAGTRIIKLNATDEDNDDSVIINFKLISGNPEGFFEITSTGK